MANTLTLTADAMLLDWMFDAASVTRPTAWYMALHTGANGGSGASNEIVGNGYARQSVTFTRSSNTITNSNAIAFGPDTTANWGTVTDITIWTASTGGTCLAQGTATSSVTYAVGDTATVAVGAESITLTEASRVRKGLPMSIHPDPSTLPLLLDWMFSTATLVRPTAWYMALYGHVGHGSGAELSGSWYARQPLTFVRTGNVMALASDVVFGPTTASVLGGIGSLAVLNAITGGGTYFSITFAAGTGAVGVGTTITISASTFDLSIT